MSDMPKHGPAYDVAWDVPVAEILAQLKTVGIELAPPPEKIAAEATLRDLHQPVRAAWAADLRESVVRARSGAPPVRDWSAVAERLILEDVGSTAVQDRADEFWLSLGQIVYGSRALVCLGDLSEFPFFIDLLRFDPAGHLAELATDILSHYVDARHELQPLALIGQAQAWWQERCNAT